ncbi:antibiotic biosynthesis monooxygenase family protein [Streptomyces sp. NPDC091281]|uniref:antibiotic biosynthesis monooxygenase family protein n=1 Tax=Streptomyces sp. NPDC091281 TaxID=3365985 RepID=UPI003829D9CC
MRFTLTGAAPAVHVAAWETTGDPAAVIAAARGGALRWDGLPGFAGAAWFTRRRDLHPVRRDGDAVPAPEGAAAARIVELVWWERPAGHTATGAVDRAVASGALPDGRAVRVQGGLQHLQGIVTPSGAGEFTLGEDGGVTLVLLGESEDAAAALAYLMTAAEETVRFVPGFVGGAFLLAEDGTRLTEVIRWASPEAFRAATADEGFRSALGRASAYVKVDGGVYTTRAVHPAPARPSAG